MIFEKELMLVRILDVISISQKNINMKNSARKFDALSFRIRSDACLFCDKGEFRAESGSVAFVPAGIDYKRTASVDEMIVIHFNALEYPSDTIEVIYPENTERIEKLFREILACWKNGSLGYEYRASAYLYEILSECRVLSAKEKENSKIQASVDYLMENYTRCDLTMKEIADRSFVSEVYFRKLFNQRFGMSPKKYIIRLRVQKAVELMATGYYSLKEIAYMCGYNDYKYFLVEFRRVKGVSPSEYIYDFSM